MLIGIDASRLTVARRTGTEAYALHLTRALVGLDSPHTFRLYFRDAPPARWLPLDRVERRMIPFPRLWTHLRLSAELLTRRVDVLFVPAHVLPLVHPCPSVVTVHDLGYLRFPDAHPAGERRYLDWSTRFSARHATRLLADSCATRDDLVRHYRIPSAKIVVAYPGRDESLAPVRDRESLAAVRRAYDLPRDYLLHVGTVQPRKNLLRLLEAFAPHASRITLVLAGRRGWLSEPIYARVSELGLEGRVRFLDYVADEHLPALYSGAHAYVFPSLYEGFGFTVLEAMACGAPVICSDGGSLPEVAGEAALLVPATDTSALSAAIERLLDDEALRAELTARGFEQAKEFEWERAARATLAVIEAAGGFRPTPATVGIEPSGGPDQP